MKRRRIAVPESGVEIALLDWGGDGPLVLLQHANGFCAALWDPIARELARAFRVIGMDARGHGRSSRPAGDDAYRWERFGDDLVFVAETLAAEHGGGRVALGLGHSFGGTVTIMAAARRPALFGRLLLVDPVVHPPVPAPVRAQRVSGLVETARQRRAVWPSRDEARARWAGKELFAGWRDEVLDLYLAEGLRDRPGGQVELACPPAVESAVFMNGVHFDVWALAPKVEAPTRVLWATGGNFPRALVENFASLLGDAAVVPIDAGHLAPMEQPELVLEHVWDLMGVAQDSTG